MKGKASRQHQNTKNKTADSRLPEHVALPDDGHTDGSPLSGKEVLDQDVRVYRIDRNLVYSSVAPNLVLNTDEFLNIDTNNKIEVILKKCCCKCVWCPSCWEYFYVPKLRSIMEEMDYRKVRHITPTIARDQFNTLEDAYRLFNAGEFVSRLTRGKKKQVGINWTAEYIFEPIQWQSYLWFVEFHVDGAAHFHVVLEVEISGNKGMIGGDRLRYYWPYGRINERYFKTEKHWQNFMGYEVKKGYASKDKNHQGKLPELLDQAGSKKLRRWGHSREKKEKTEEEKFNELDQFLEEKELRAVRPVILYQ